MSGRDAVVRTYSRLANEYDGQGNQTSCWGRATRRALDRVQVTGKEMLVCDMGCGTGRAVAELAEKFPSVEFIGLEPADRMRDLAADRLSTVPNARADAGRFESIPLDDDAIDYLFSIMAFHWTTDVDASVRELARAMGPSSRGDLFFIGRRNGGEFIRATTPIFMRHMGAEALLAAASVRKQLTAAQAQKVFGDAFGPERVSVTESFDTYYDTLEGHWSWWVRIEGQFVDMPPDVRERCDEEVRTGLAALEEDRGIPYTIHQLHVQITS